MDVGGFKTLEATEAGLREGAFFDELYAGEPDRLVPDVRHASVLNLAAQYHPGKQHTKHVARLALEIWDELATAGVHEGRADERELLWAAAVLHDIGTAVDYDDHHKHSRYLILNAGLPGYSPRETALIGQMARYHRKGEPGLREYAPLGQRGDEELLARCAAVLRVAEQLERARDQAVRHADVTVEDGRVRLELRTREDTTVARWGAERQADLFERAFGRQGSPSSADDGEPARRSRRELHDLVDAGRAVRVLHVPRAGAGRSPFSRPWRVQFAGSVVPWRWASRAGALSIAAQSVFAQAPTSPGRSSAAGNARGPCAEERPEVLRDVLVPAAVHPARRRLEGRLARLERRAEVVAEPAAQRGAREVSQIAAIRRLAGPVDEAVEVRVDPAGVTGRPR